jgi:peptide/nickel transport system substrate-binding protein
VKRRIYGTLVVLALAGAACGGGDDEGDEATAEATADAATAEATEDAATAEATGGDTEAPATGEGLTIALGSEPTSLDPHTVDDGGERAINDNIYETLLARDANGELIPGLATDLPTQVDPTTWEFTLREGVTFHDGTPFNADAVVASVDRIVRLVAETKTQNDGFFGFGCAADFSGDYSFVDLAGGVDECGAPALAFNCPTGTLAPGYYRQFFGNWPSGAAGIVNLGKAPPQAGLAAF